MLLNSINAAPAPIQAAFAAVKAQFPQVVAVCYGQDMRWDYFDAFGKSPEFNSAVCVATLEDAADALTATPVVYSIQGELERLESLWNLFTFVNVVDGETETDFLHFEAGTDVIEIWAWFESQSPEFKVAR